MVEMKRKGVTIQVNPRAREVLETLRDDTGVPNTEALVRILEWFASLDRKHRLAILNRDLETRRELVTIVLEQMRDDPARDLNSPSSGGSGPPRHGKNPPAFYGGSGGEISELEHPPGNVTPESETDAKSKRRRT